METRLHDPRVFVAVLVLFFLSAGTACGGTTQGAASSSGAEKGPEEDPLEGGKADSFFEATDHGEIEFGGVDRAEFDDSKNFHSWDFTLEDDASIDLRIEASNNMDTVMYLYHREVGEEYWGSYVAKNDDSGGALTSRIRREGKTGEYRVIVKGYKIEIRGSFELHAACEGPGCPSGDAKSCSPDSFRPLPDSADSGGSCAESTMNVLAEPVTSQREVSVDIDDRCEMSSVASRSIEYYRAYWRDETGLGALPAGERTEMSLDIVRHGDVGTSVTVDMGSVEDDVVFLYDSSEKLVALHHRSQSSRSLFYGCEEGGADRESPSADCMETAIRGVRHEAGAAETITGQADSLSGTRQAELIRAAVEQFEENVGAMGMSVEYEARLWNSEGFGEGAAVTVKTESDTMRYVVSKLYDEYPYIISKGSGGSRTFVCEER